MYIPFILFDSISKNIFFNCILNFAILSVFSVRNVIITFLTLKTNNIAKHLYLALIGGGGFDQFTASQSSATSMTNIRSPVRSVGSALYCSSSGPGLETRCMWNLSNRG